MPLFGKLQKFREDLAAVDDPQERLAIIVDRAGKGAALSADARIGANRVAGCVSVVWLAGTLRGEVCEFRSDAESPVVRGLVAFLCECYSGMRPEAILASESDPLEHLGLARNLSPTRRNGLAAARAAIRAFAARQLAERGPQCKRSPD
jgi:cysteine desulfuration protein SufE